MKNVLTFLCIASVLALGSFALAADDSLTKVRQRGKLIWGADQEGGGPFVFPSTADPNKLEGFEVELAELIAQHLGVKAEFAQGQWDKLPDLVDRGDIDVVLNGYEWTADRTARYGCSIPYYIYELQLLARKDDKTLTNWGDVVNTKTRRRVCALGGSAAHDYLQALKNDKLDIVLFDGATDAMRATELAADDIDANLQDLPVWTFFQEGFPKLAAVDKPVGRGYYVAITRKEDTELLQQINEAIVLGLRDGRLRKIFAHYRIWNATQAERALETNAAGTFVGDALAKSNAGDDGEKTYDELRGWQLIFQRGHLLVIAAGMTIALACTAMPLAVLAGLSLALLRQYGPWFFGRVATFYVEIIRGTPLILQLYVIFFLLPEIGISINAFWAAVIGLAINYSAYEAEIYRAGLQAIPKGQMEAAVSLGMSRWLAIRRIIVPQATKLVIPPVTNDFIALFEGSAVCSVITVVELSKEYYIQARSTGGIVELGLLTAFLYLLMSYPLSILATRLERNLSREHAA